MERKRDASSDASLFDLRLLLDLKLSCCGNRFDLLGHIKFQDTIAERGGDSIHVNAGNIKTPAEAAEITLTFYVVLLLFLVLVLALSSDGEAVVLNIKADILFAESGKLGFKDIRVAVINDVGAESIYTAAGIAEKSPLKLFKVAEWIKSGNT